MLDWILEPRKDRAEWTRRTSMSEWTALGQDWLLVLTILLWLSKLLVLGQAVWNLTVLGEVCPSDKNDFKIKIHKDWRLESHLCLKLPLLSSFPQSRVVSPYWCGQSSCLPLPLLLAASQVFAPQDSALKSKHLFWLGVTLWTWGSFGPCHHAAHVHYWLKEPLFPLPLLQLFLDGSRQPTSLSPELVIKKCIGN